jgi:hypothetical protein
MVPARRIVLICRRGDWNLGIDVACDTFRNSLESAIGDVDKSISGLPYWLRNVFRPTYDLKG